MKSYFHFASALLACLTVLPSLIACGKSTPDIPDPTAPAAAETESQTIDPNDRSQIRDSLPDTLDFSGRSIAAMLL